MLDYVKEETLLLSEYSIDGGSESLIYNVESINSSKLKLYKQFQPNYNTVFKNKEQKLILLNENDVVKKDSITASKLVLNDDSNIISGYLMDKYNGKSLESDKEYLTYSESIQLLKQIRSILIKYWENDIYYFDPSVSNFLYTKNGDDFEVKVIDMDNVAINEYTVDLYSDILEIYLINGGELNKNAFILAFNTFTLELLRIHNPKIVMEMMYNSLPFKEMWSNIHRCKYDCLADHEYLLDYADSYKTKILH